MGATDVLPYPRRRSSIPLTPIEIHPPGVPLPDSPLTKTVFSPVRRTFGQFSRGSSSDDGSFAVTKTLGPLRTTATQRRCESPDQERCRSCEGLKRTRSNSLHRLNPRQRPGESRRKTLGNADDAETMAQFIEKIRLELIAQL